MDVLPINKADRVAGESYLYKNEVVIWNGKILHCEHNRRRSRCKECGGSQICEHNRERSQCKECGGASICEHNRRRSSCKECGGSQICEHNRERSRCKECGGASICEHNRERRYCKECGGSQICEHNRERRYCKECGGSQICEHNRRRSSCKECGGSEICEHNRIRSRCKECGGASICEHNIITSICKECGGSQICEHNIIRSQCKECNLHGYIASQLRNRIRSAIFYGMGEKAYSSIELLGCTINDCRIHLERQFSEEMSWDNHGEWHIDHRKPCAEFDLTDPDEQKKCFHYTNLQPMWAPENLSKNDYFNEEDFDWEWNGSMWIEKL